MQINNAIVIGAGIGGLTVAAALANRGVAVTLVERAQRIREVGAGLQVTPNGMAVLRALGLSNAVERRAVAAQAVVLRPFDQDAPVARLDLRGHRQQYLFVHRSDLIDILDTAARQANVSMELGAEVASVLPGPTPTLKMADGSTRRAELIVGADGLHSIARGALNGADAPQFTGQVAWRATVPNTMNHPNEAHVTMGAGRHVVSYPLRGGKLVNLVAVEERSDWAEEGWSHPDDPAHMRAAFAGFGGLAGDVLQAADKVLLWGLHKHPVAPVWHKDGVALLGDAAHPTLPFLAQGANMALEDAWVLADCLRNAKASEALASYQAQRAPRVRKVVDAASRNAWRYHLKPGPVRFAAHTAMRTISRIAPSRMIGAFDWLYDVDVTKGK